MKRDRIKRAIVTNIILVLILLIFIGTVTISATIIGTSTDLDEDFDELKINEFVSDDSGEPDWVEIYYGVDGDLEIDLDNCRLEDETGNIKFIGGDIDPGEFIAFDWSNRLNKLGDSIELICNDVTVDKVSYGDIGDAPQPEEGNSVGRCPDNFDTDDDANDFDKMVQSKGWKNDCSRVVPACGDWWLDIGEQCDDGNTKNGDGCSSTCKIEKTTSFSSGGSKSGGGIGISIETEEFEPRLWVCGSRAVFDDNTQPGRVPGNFLFERMNNYAFEGEQITWRVLVMDKNGLEKINDVYATVGCWQDPGNPIEANCQFVEKAESVDANCNARILEEELVGKDLSDVAGYWDCTLTVETPDSMWGESWITIEAEDNSGLIGTIDENENWFLNPTIALSIQGDLTFDNVRPGTLSYSKTLLIGNDADPGSGVMLDMFISGTNFYDSSSSGAACPTSNQLSLSNFRYFAGSGAYSTSSDARSDVEGYVPIGYGIGFNDPSPFYNKYEIIQGAKTGPLNAYYSGNLLTPRSELALTFRLDLPEPCNGDFDTGQIYFWGEAV